MTIQPIPLPIPIAKKNELQHERCSREVTRMKMNYERSAETVTRVSTVYFKDVLPLHLVLPVGLVLRPRGPPTASSSTPGESNSTLVFVEGAVEMLRRLCFLVLYLNNKLV